jgi:hypothetical protein
MKSIYQNILHNLPFMGFACLFSACSNTTIVMHKNAMDINAEFTADLASPVGFNAGYESRASVAVPPKNSQPLSSLFDQFVLPQGDVLSTVSAVKVERPKVDGALGGVALDFVSAAATGKAATVLTSKKKSGESNGVKTLADPNTFGAAAASITKDPGTGSPDGSGGT